MGQRLRFRQLLGSMIRSTRRYANEVATVGPDDSYARKFFYFGAGAALMAPQGVVYNERYLSIGDGALIGPNHPPQTGAMAYLPTADATKNPDEPVGWQTPSVATVRIGSGSWLGANVVILPGTVLGRNTTVAAGAVVRGEFPDHVVLGGVPAKVLRHYSAERGWQSGPAEL